MADRPDRRRCDTILTHPTWKRVKARVEHICADAPGGPREDSNQTPWERQNFANPMLMCPEPPHARQVFISAAVDWAAGGRGQPLVDAAADALAAGLDSPTLRVLAGAPRAAADEEATELAPLVFEELGISVHERLSPPALVEGGRQLATRFLAQGGSPRTLAKDLYRLYVAAGYPDELADWSGFDDWYDMLEGGVISGRIDDADAAVADAARALVDGRPSKHVRLDVLFEQTPKPERRFLGLRRRRP